MLRCLSLLLFLCLPITAAIAIMSGEESRVVRSSDSEYADGKEAFEAGEWRQAINWLNKVVARRPWHDNAHNMLGFSWRQIGDYDRAFIHYYEALRLNPRHRGALEYLATTYLELGRIDEANATAIRLTEVCDFSVMAFDNQGWKSGCEELQILKAAYAKHNVPMPGSD